MGKGNVCLVAIGSAFLSAVIGATDLDAKSDSALRPSKLTLDTTASHKYKVQINIRRTDLALSSSAADESSAEYEALFEPTELSGMHWVKLTIVRKAGKLFNKGELRPLSVIIQIDTSGNISSMAAAHAESKEAEGNPENSFVMACVLGDCLISFPSFPLSEGQSWMMNLDQSHIGRYDGGPLTAQGLCGLFGYTWTETRKSTTGPTAILESSVCWVDQYKPEDPDSEALKARVERRTVQFSLDSHVVVESTRTGWNEHAGDFGHSLSLLRVHCALVDVP